MRTVEEHRGAVLAAVGSLAADPSWVVPVAPLDALGLALAEPVLARVDLPGFDNSSMDGYAVVASSLAGAGDSPVRLRVVGESAAGRPYTGPPVQEGEAVRIMTGAVMPEGADAVVAVEQTEPLDAVHPAHAGASPNAGGGDEWVECRAEVRPGQFVRRRGEDLSVGDPVGRAGETIGPRTIAVLVASGHAEVRVRRRLRVAVMSTGDELAAPGASLRPGQIHDSNTPMLVACLRLLGCAVSEWPVRSDDESTFLKALSAATAQVDAVVTSGGVSMGAHDVVKAALRERGVQFVQVAMQPGKPQGFGFVPVPDGRSIPVFALPGNPVSSYVSFQVFVRPALVRLMGVADRAQWVPVQVAGSLRSPAGREQYARAVVTTVDGQLVARPVEGQGSHVLGDLSLANALLRIPAEVEAVRSGDVLHAQLLEEAVPHHG